MCPMAEPVRTGYKTIPDTAGAEQWFALRIAPRHEKAASEILCNKGYETLLPLYQQRHQYGRRSRSFELPLFPGYLFCRFDSTVRLPILTTPGVLRVIGAGKTPIPVAEEEILPIQRAMETHISMIPHPYGNQGQRGRITSGPLAGVEGVVMSTRPPVKLVLSVELLQRSLLLEVDADCVRLT